MKDLKTLQDIKDKIEELEQDLPYGVDLSMIPLQHNITDEYDNFDIEIYNYLGFYYASINIDNE